MINVQDNELLSRYLDGELNQAEHSSLQARLEAEPLLAAYLQRLQRVDQLLQATLRAEGAVPVQVVAMLAPEQSNVVQLSPRREQRWSYAVAASLFAGLALLGGQQWVGVASSNLLVPDIAQAPAFSEILEQQASSASNWYPVAGDVHMRPLLTFASSGGTWCREFLANQASESWRGIACRRGAHWDVELLVQSPGLAAENTGYQTASADSAELVASYIHDNSQDIPLGLQQEMALIANSWR